MFMSIMGIITPLRGWQTHSKVLLSKPQQSSKAPALDMLFDPIPLLSVVWLHEGTHPELM